MTALASELDALLPQTQCTRCGYPGCRPYAEAIVSGAADINQCPPGGSSTIAALAMRLQREPIALNPQYGSETAAMVAVIDEARCIGCAKCLPPCPVDAIIGASRQMHSVLYAACTGCELCIAPCPVDCITLLPRAKLPAAMLQPEPTAAQNRSRHNTRLARQARDAAERAALLTARKSAALSVHPHEC